MMTEHSFPSGTPLVAALVDLHREVDDPNVVELIESEITTEAVGLVSVAVPEEMPAPDASVESLVELHEEFASRDKSVGRYIRLRIFEELGAFDDDRSDRVTDSSDVFEGLTEEERQHLREVDDPHIQMLIEDDEDE